MAGSFRCVVACGFHGSLAIVGGRKSGHCVPAATHCACRPASISCGISKGFLTHREDGKTPAQSMLGEEPDERRETFLSVL
jgi:hypothetical protein